MYKEILTNQPLTCEVLMKDCARNGSKICDSLYQEGKSGLTPIHSSPR